MGGFPLHLDAKAEGAQGIHIDAGQAVAEGIIPHTAEMGLLSIQRLESMAQDIHGVIALAQLGGQVQQGEAIIEWPQVATGGVPVEAAVKQADAITKQGRLRVNGVKAVRVQGHDALHQGLEGARFAVTAKGDVVGQLGGLKDRGQGQKLLLLRVEAFAHAVSSMTAPPRHRGPS